MNEMSSLPLEDFIQAITSQLDRTQMSMALKAQAGLPMTFAVKDLSLDLRAHLDMQGGAVTIRPAGPGDGDASTLHLELTTITRPMIEENTRDLATAQGGPTIRDVLGDELSDEEERRLEWIGIQDVAQYRALERSGGNRLVEKVARRPIDKLKFALESAAQPRIDNIEPIRPDRGRIDPDEAAIQPDHSERLDVDTTRQPERPPIREDVVRRPERPRIREDVVRRPGHPSIREAVIRPDLDQVSRVGESVLPRRLLIRGDNLRGTSGRPVARIDANPVPIVELGDDRIIVQPLAHQTHGTVEIETAEGIATVDFAEIDDEAVPGDDSLPSGQDKAT